MAVISLNSGAEAPSNAPRRASLPSADVPKRQVILMKSVDPADDDDGGLPALGSTKDVLAALARFNTAPDGRGAGQADRATLACSRSTGPAWWSRCPR